MAAEMASYHGPGTCTFYGTANTNQMLMEFMGLHLPGASFVNPGTPLREALTTAAVERAAAITALGNDFRPAGEILDERAYVNGIVGLMATGGSTNLVLHLPAMARAAGVLLDLQDFADLSEAVPLMAKVYPNGLADVNHFHAAGGPAVPDRPAAGRGPSAPRRQDRRGRRPGRLPAGTDAGRRPPGLARRRRTPRLNDKIVRPAADPFAAAGRAEATDRQPWARRDQGLGRRARAPRDRGPGPHLPQPGRREGRLQGGRVHHRHRRRRPLPGPAGQRHAGTALADPDACRSCRTAG